MERQELYNTFSQLDWRQQVGNLASTLSSIAKHAGDERYDPLTQHLLREGALMIEWCYGNVPEDYHLELASLQRELLTWQKAHPVEGGRHLLVLHTQNQSNRLLQMSGMAVA
jgi:hypothetical protein